MTALSIQRKRRINKVIVITGASSGFGAADGTGAGP